MKYKEELLEQCSEAVHKAYCDYYLKSNGVEYWTHGDYSSLEDVSKQIDRITVIAVLDYLKKYNQEESLCQ